MSVGNLHAGMPLVSICVILACMVLRFSVSSATASSGVMA